MCAELLKKAPTYACSHTRTHIHPFTRAVGAPFQSCLHIRARAHTHTHTRTHKQTHTRVHTHTHAAGGCLDAGEELRAFTRAVGAPITQTLMGLGAYPTDDPQSMQMLGMHGTVYASYAIDQVCVCVCVCVCGDFV